MAFRKTGRGNMLEAASFILAVWRWKHSCALRLLYSLAGGITLGFSASVLAALRSCGSGLPAKRGHVLVDLVVGSRDGAFVSWISGLTRAGCRGVVTVPVCRRRLPATPADSSSGRRMARNGRRRGLHATGRRSRLATPTRHGYKGISIEWCGGKIVIAYYAGFHRFRVWMDQFYGLSWFAPLLILVKEISSR